MHAAREVPAVAAAAAPHLKGLGVFPAVRRVGATAIALALAGGLGAVMGVFLIIPGEVREEPCREKQTGGDLVAKSCPSVGGQCRGEVMTAIGATLNMAALQPCTRALE